MALRDYVRGDPLLRRFFDEFVFEDDPATDHLYLEEVEGCDLYAGCSTVTGEDNEGLSPTVSSTRDGDTT